MAIIKALKINKITETPDKNKKINRIVIFTLESFYSHGAVTELINSFQDKAVLIIFSQRYGGKYGSFLHQLKKNLKYSGFSFVEYLSFHFVYYYIFIYLINFFNIITFRKKRVYSLKQLARKNNINFYKTKNVNSSNIRDKIKAFKPDLIVSSYFDQLIKKETYNIAEFGAINIHPGILPDNRGVFPPIAAEVNNYKQGCTVHYVNENLDEGEILQKQELIKEKKQSILSLDYDIMEKGARVCIDSIKKIEKGNITSTLQEKNQGNYHSFPNKKDIKILKSKKISLFSIKEFIRRF